MSSCCSSLSSSPPVKRRLLTHPMSPSQSLTSSQRTFTSTSSAPAPLPLDSRTCKLIRKRRRRGDKINDIKDFFGISTQAVYNALTYQSKVVVSRGRRKTPARQRVCTLVTQLLAAEGMQHSISGIYKTLRDRHPNLVFSKCTVERVIKRDLGLKSLARTKRHFLDEAMKRRRLDNSLRLRQFLQDNPEAKICWSDEKNFTMNEVCNPQSQRFIAKDLKWARANLPFQVRHSMKKGHTPSVTAYLALYETGEYFLYFYPKGVKVTKETYQICLTKQIEYQRATFGLEAKHQDSYTFQQDGARPHTAKKTQQFLKKHFGSKWLPPKFWPPYSPDVSPLDNAAWAAVEKVSNAKALKTLPNLRDAIKNACEEVLKPEFVSKICKKERAILKLTEIIECQGGIPD
jgi:hypothetical protein